MDKAVEETLKELNNEKLIVEKEKDTDNGMTESELKFIDLCCGIGGFHIGLKGYQCVLACDINKHCRESYERNYGLKCEEDIFDIDIQNLKPFDILCAGFPCQPFSSAGLKNGMKDDRSKVYNQILNIVKHKTPSIVLLENVKNLLVMNKGEVIKKIVNDLKELNYSVSYSILTTARFGLAQNRERVYFVCVNKTKYPNSTFDFSKLESTNIKKTLRETISCGNKEYLPVDKYVLLDQERIKTQKSGLMFCGYLKGNLRKNGALPDTEHLSRVHKQPNRIYHIDGVNPTLSSSEGSGRYYIYDGTGVRNLNVDECFKIMGFPDYYKQHDKKHVNYCQIGNAVSPVIVESIKNELINQGFVPDG